MFWPLQSRSKFLGVLEDSKFPLLGVWVSSSHLAQSGVATLAMWLWPLKVKNWPDLLACKYCATYRWKALDEGYNFALDRIAIKDLHEKLWAPKVVGVPIVGISGLPLGSLETKSHLDVASVERCKIYYKGEGGGFPQVQAVVSLVSSNCLWLILAPKVLQLCTNHFVLVLCRFVWVIEVCRFFLVPFRSSSTPLYPSKVLQTRERALIPYSFVVFNLGFTFESFKELGARHNYKYTIHGEKGAIVQHCYVTIVKEVGTWHVYQHQC